MDMHSHCGDIKVPGAPHISAQPRDGRRPPHCNAQSCCLSSHCLLGGYLLIFFKSFCWWNLAHQSFFFLSRNLCLQQLPGSSSLSLDSSPPYLVNDHFHQHNIFVFIPFLVITINITIIITINIMPCSKACGFLRLRAALFLTQLRTWRILQGTPCLSSSLFSLKRIEDLYFILFFAAACCWLQRNSF